MAQTRVAGTASKPARAAGKGGKRSFVWLQGLICGAVATLATPLAILLTFLLAPGLIALVLDRSPGRPTARAVLLFGLAASVAPAKTLWEGGLTMPGCVDIMTDPIIFGTAWAAAAFGWLTGEAAPIIIELMQGSGRRLRAKRLAEARAKYAEEWGIELEQS